MTDKGQPNKDLDKEEKDMADQGEKGNYVVGEAVKPNHQTPTNAEPSK